MSTTFLAPEHGIPSSGRFHNSHACVTMPWPCLSSQTMATHRSRCLPKHLTINMARKGSSKGAPAPDPVQEITDAIPTSVRQQAEPLLCADHWSVRTLLHTKLDSQGGVAICPRSSIAETLRRVGQTRAPTAILVAQRPAEIGLKGYRASQTEVTILVLEEVTQSTTGEEVQVRKHMHKLQLRFYDGWPDEQVPSFQIVHWLLGHLPEDTFAEVLSRHNKSASVWVHSSQDETLLKACGEGHVFVKLAEGETCGPDLHLLWLPEGTAVHQAKALPRHEGLRGLARKGEQQNYRLALRFAQEAQLAEYATTHGYEYTPHLQRWSLYGLQLPAGQVGAFELLQSMEWTVEEVLYMDSKEVAFTATVLGRHAPCHYRNEHGQTRALRFRAQNAAAQRAAMEGRTQAGATTAASTGLAERPSGVSRAAAQRARLQALAGEQAPPQAKAQAKVPQEVAPCASANQDTLPRPPPLQGMHPPDRMGQAEERVATPTHRAPPAAQGDSPPRHKAKIDAAAS
eukprot:6492558-Amphidinium_carterae.1